MFSLMQFFAIKFKNNFIEKQTISNMCSDSIDSKMQWLQLLNKSLTTLNLCACYFASSLASDLLHRILPLE